MKVLIGVDGSDHSFAAVSLVGQLLNPGRDRVGIYHSCEGVMFSEAVDESLQQRACQAVSDVIFDEARQRLPEGLRADSETIAGRARAAEELLTSGEQWGAELIVVGARGLGPMAGVLLGSVSNAVVRGARTPVLIVRGTARQQTSPLKSLRLLVAYEKRNAEAQGAFLRQLQWPSGVTGHLVTVIESLLPSHLPEWIQKRARDADTEAMSQVWVREHEQEREQTLAELTAYRQQLPAPLASLQPLVAEGNPAEQLMRALDRHKADLIVIGKTVHGLFDRLLLGSTSEKVISHAPCSVLVIPTEGA